MRRPLLSTFALLAIALYLSPSLGLAAAPSGRPIAPADLNYEINEARSLRAKLRVQTGLIAESGRDHVFVTLFGGLPSSSATVSLTPGPTGLWAIEKIERRYDFATNTLLKAKARRSMAGKAASDQISLLLASERLYSEPTGLDGGCTDQPITVVEIVFKGRRRDAVRTGCPPHDLTWQLVEAVYEAEPRDGR